MRLKWAREECFWVLSLSCFHARVASDCRMDFLGRSTLKCDRQGYCLQRGHRHVRRPGEAAAAIHGRTYRPGHPEVLSTVSVESSKDGASAPSGEVATPDDAMRCARGLFGFRNAVAEIPDRYFAEIQLI
jgi:hypothetical protein